MREEKGITLIALGITIIILLILAGVSFGTMKDKKSIINEATDKTQIAEKESIIQKVQADLYNEEIKTGNIPNRMDLKALIQNNGHSSSISNNSFVSKKGEYTINYNEILGWEDNYAKKQLILHLDGINNTGYGDENHSGTTDSWKNLTRGGKDGTIKGAIWNKDNLSFDGQDDWVELGQYVDKNAITVETTVMLKSIQTGNACILGNWESGGFGIYLNNGRAVADIWMIHGYKQVKANEALKTNQIYTISETYNGESLKLYINGELKASEPATGKIGNPESKAPMVIGGNPSGNGVVINERANINMYSARIYDRALTEDEIKNNYEVDRIRFNF